MFKTDTWLKRVLLAVLAPLRFLRFGRQTLLLINVMSLHLTTVEDLNKECSFFNLHSFCIFLIFLPKKTLTFTKKCQTPLLMVLTPHNTPQALLRALPLIVLLPPPSPVHHPLPFPPQVFILEEVAHFNWSDEEGEDSEELRLRTEEEAEEAATTGFLNAPACCRRRRRLGQSSSESSASGLSNSNEADSSDNSSEGSSNGSNLRDDEGEEEEEEDDDEGEEMEYLAPDYPQEDFRDDTDAYAPKSP